MNDQTTEWTPKGLDYLAATAPAALAAEAAPGRSARYTYVSSVEVVQALEDLGYGVIAAKQRTTRIADRTPFAGHMIVMQRREDPVDAAFAKAGKLVGRNDGVLRLALVNSHDGRGAYQMRLGFYRFVCENQAIHASTSAFARSVRHTDLSMAAVVSAAREIASQHDAFARNIERMTRRELSHTEAFDFAAFARGLRWNEGDVAPKPEVLLEARRAEDEGRHLWEVFNTVQENIIRGGIECSGKNRNGRNVTRRARPIKAVANDLRINGRLLTYAESLIAV